MEARYNPSDVEKKWFNFWKDNHLFVASQEDESKPSYSVLMPPPNVTNVLHLGHALNNTLQDVMVRYHRMQGYAAMWKIGVDHAGIATQNVVERELAKEGLSREELGKDEFIKRIWQWKEKYGSNILEQFQRLGVSGDWEHDRFTMDEVSSRAVKEIFVKLYRDGLVYRGEYIINWCVHCLTTISDDEVEYEETQGNLYVIKYQLEDGEFLQVATTRPETILGDVALAVHPEDTRYSKWIGRSVKVPTLERWIPVIADKSVEPNFGTGVLKITPSHDIIDFEIGKRHQLPFLEVIDEHGKMNATAGTAQGLDRFEYRKLFVKQLKEQGLLEEIRSHQHARGTCYRCHNIIEPRVSTQWFVKMKSLAEPAKKVLEEGKVQFTPKKWEKVYFHWMNHIKDWSISRQLWWGHAIPAYYCQNCQHIMVSVTPPKDCDQCHSTDIKADPDVLDTWFSSWIWPFTVFDACEYTKPNWQTREMERYYPTQYLATAPEIIFFWVARMIMAGMYLTDKVPFTQVFFNSTICDMQGRKMSKSLGNGIDPIDIIDEHGADAMRFTLLFIAPKGERIRVDRKSFDVGSRLVTKLWNASRFIYSYRPSSLGTDNSLTLSPQTAWESFIVIRYLETLRGAQDAVSNFDYYTLTHTLYHFFWNDFCDWFLESQKVLLQGEDLEAKTRIYLFLETLLDGILRLFHPIMPFVTEEIWQNLQTKDGLALIQSPYDILKKISSSLSLEELLADKNLREGYKQTLQMQKLILELRSTKKDLGISDKENLVVFQDSNLEEIQISILKHFVNLSMQTKKQENAVYLSIVSEEVQFYVQLPKDIDIQKERDRLSQELNKILSEIKRAEEKLINSEFVKNASSDLVEKEKEKLVEFQDRKYRLENFLESLGD